MGSITGNFQSETPLHPAAKALLLEAFDRGWANPTKVHQSSREAYILLNEAKETFAFHLGIRPDQVEILADSSLGFHMGISGLLDVDSTLYFSSVDRTEVFAVADHAHGAELHVALDGFVQYPQGAPGDVLAWQSANGETGIISRHPEEFRGRVFVDATASGELLKLPDRWHTCLWSSKAWAGPAGLGIFAIHDKGVWQNPLPHRETRISTPEISLPLVMASAIALEAHALEFERKLADVRAMNQSIRQYLKFEIPDIDLAGELGSTLPHLLSFSILYVDAQLLVSELDRRGFSVDSGSACSAANMEPSHVLAAMGILTHGNIRLTLHLNAEESAVNEFLSLLKELVLQARD